MAAKAEDRGEKIIKLLLREGEATLEEILAAVGSSAPSIRRDLSRLEQRGLIRRTHGGATLVEPLLYEPFRYDQSFQARNNRYAREKRRIGLAAAELIADNETVGLTAGTTTTQIGRSIRHRANITVITNAINIGMELCNQPRIRTWLTGGAVPFAWSFSLTGPTAVSSLSGVYMDKVFLGVIGIDAIRGATTGEADEALTFRTMVEHGKQVIAVADSSKLGHVSPSLICPLASIHMLITDTGASEESVAEFAARGVRVLRV